MHSSTVTVAVMRPAITDLAYMHRSERDYAIEWYSGSGAGGQHRNRHMNSARVTHRPTGITRTAQSRSRENSLKMAMTAIDTELDRLAHRAIGDAENDLRREQVGSGQRSDKRRTYRFQDDMVKDHVTGKKATTTHIMAGKIELLW